MGNSIEYTIFMALNATHIILWKDSRGFFKRHTVRGEFLVGCTIGIASKFLYPSCVQNFLYSSMAGWAWEETAHILEFWGVPLLSF